ncbi:hypothetical protein [Methylobacterium sp. yr596]|uniref:hypothetical protein n=1 Tax=Methylobacterium sp. yr596 TaxID=1761800 RepID=UPI0008F35469|nr:hypothetical protein [Methylobacterium sp. yr596]SFE90245.1 hypothetical protein SAMN04487844_107132 [Methylobacterium sp. yr596]
MDGLPEAVAGADAWRDFICDPGRAGRYLAPVGSSMVGADAERIDPATLDALRSGLLDGGERDLPLLAEALDLSRPDYATFFAEDLPGLLDALASERQHEDEVVGPALRGSPRWDRTILGRRTGSILPTHYASRVPVRSFALPENELVRWLVSSVIGGIDAISRRTAGRIPPMMQRVSLAATDALGHPWFSEVPPPRDLEPHMLACAERQRLPGYHVAAKLAERRARLEDRDPASRWEAMLDLLRSRWLEPVDPDDLFELYVLVLVLDVLERDLGLGAPTEYGLVLGARRHVAAFAGGVRVLFDQSPAVALGLPTRFADVAAAHENLRDSPRRPDIVVLRDGAEPRAALVEVKRSHSERYRSDSIYKAFAYLHDFAALWDARPGRPRLLLVLPEAMRPRPGVDLAEQDMIVVGADARDAVAEVLRLALGLGTRKP